MERICEECGNELTGQQRKFCSKECKYKRKLKKVKEWYKENKDIRLKKRKKYYNKNKEKISGYNKIYNQKPEVKIKRRGYQKKYCNTSEVKEMYRKWTKEYKIRTNYASEKTPKQKYNKNIRLQTRKKYPIREEKCEFCSNDATEHHHYTEPIEIDKFNYICHDCHKLKNKEMKGGEADGK